MINRRFPALASERIQGFVGIAFYRLLTFALVNFAWVFFRLVHFSDIKLFFKQLIWNVAGKENLGMNQQEIIFSLFLMVGLYCWDLKGLALRNLPAKYFVVLAPVLLFVIYFFGVFSLKQFIYFQF